MIDIIGSDEFFRDEVAPQCKYLPNNYDDNDENLHELPKCILIFKIVQLLNVFKT